MPLMLNAVEETLLIPLWHRAQVSIQYPSLFCDPKAIELVEAIDYDFSLIDRRFSPEYRLTGAARARQCDTAIRAYIADHPRASVINLGAGLDTTFYRVDNGLIEWYDLDLCNVIDVRKQLIPETDRSHCIAKSLLDMSWCDALTNTDNGVFVVASAVLPYFDEGQVKTFFSALADRLPGAEMVFSAYSQREASRINRSLRRVGMTNSAMKWALEDVNDLTRWDDSITVVDEIPYFRDIPDVGSWGKEIERRIHAIDEQKLMMIVHVRM